MKPKIKPSFLTFDYVILRDGLECEGWKTPQTYCNSFGEAGDFPAVYMFVLVDHMNMKISRPAYVGMSTRLSQRWSGHEVLSELENMDAWVQRWFLRVPRCKLREVESFNINKFDPPWNVIGKKRGASAL